MELNPEIRAYYENAPEADRLSTGCFQLEFERTKELVLRSLPKPPATVLDVGGGPGTYSVWLSSLGYDVHLIDPVEHLVAQAQQRGQSATVGDARELKWPDNSADAILELGPMYHLINQQDRLKALKEALRVLKPGGVAFFAGISRFASALDGLAQVSAHLLATGTL
jgi:ubiquinone/menaquinone biosynthesis C-methylase UbiE